MLPVVLIQHRGAAWGLRGGECGVYFQCRHKDALITRPANAGTRFTQKLASPQRKVTPLQHGKDVYFLLVFFLQAYTFEKMK